MATKCEQDAWAKLNKRSEAKRSEAKRSEARAVLLVLLCFVGWFGFVWLVGELGGDGVFKEIYNFRPFEGFLGFLGACMGELGWLLALSCFLFWVSRGFVFFFFLWVPFLKVCFGFRVCPVAQFVLLAWRSLRGGPASWALTGLNQTPQGTGGSNAHAQHGACGFFGIKERDALPDETFGNGLQRCGAFSLPCFF